MHAQPFSVGLLPGEGSGPELVDAARDIIHSVTETFGLAVRIETGGQIGCISAEKNGKYLSDEVADFCSEIFGANGAILAGAAGGRFVYDMRRRYHLYYKLNPLRSYPELRNVCRIKLPSRPLDILVVRENLQGIYHGDAVELNNGEGREVLHSFLHTENQVRAVLAKGIELAAKRRNAVAVIGKTSGTPALAALWRDCAIEMSRGQSVDLTFVDIDYAAYKLLQEPESFDVIVAPNCFADILSDLGGVLAGSRGLTFGGSFSSNGAAVYQTNHGAAHDRAGSDTANPVAQIFAVAMMFRESFALPSVASAIEDAVRSLWRARWRTPDLAEPGCRLAGTRQFGDLVAGEISLTAAREACSAAG